MAESFESKLVYTLREAALLCQVPMPELVQLAGRGECAAFQVSGGHWRIDHAGLTAFMDSRGISKPAGWDQPPRKLRVLVVEDDPDLLEITSELLKDEPRVEVRAENNGFTAGLQIAGWHPDLVVLDFLMPGISGFELCSRLRERDETADLAVLALTSLTGIDKMKEVYASGVSDFLGKPFHSQDLLRKVRRLLGLEQDPVKARQETLRKSFEA